MEQRTDEWFAARCGRVTASRVADVLSEIKTGESASRKNYRSELIIERLTGKKTEGFVNAAMQWGIDQETLAIATYEIKTGNFVDKVGFVNHPTIDMFGCSPDGYVGADGLIEVKAPNSMTHIEYLEQDKVPTKYIPQIQCQLSVTGRKWCDFVSFDPRLPDGLQILIVRLERDDEYIEKLEARVVKFLDEVNSAVNGLKEKMK
jgi:putative phage-type endonuclease